RPVATGDAEDVDVEVPKVLGGAMKVLDRVDLPHDPVVPERPRKLQRSLRVAKVLPAPRIQDDADAGHEGMDMSDGSESVNSTPRASRYPRFAPLRSLRPARCGPMFAR